VYILSLNLTVDRTKLKELQTARDEKKAALDKERLALNGILVKMDKRNVINLQNEAQEAQDKLFAASDKQIDDAIELNKKEIEKLRNKIKEQQSKTGTLDPNRIAKAVTGIDLPEKPTATPDGSTLPNYWTSVHVEVSSKSSDESSETSASSFSASATVNYGLLSVDGSVSHSQSSADAAKQMAECSAKITFDCMRVDINRSWLLPELFFDDDLTTAGGA
jgi:hypothetical protein